MRNVAILYKLIRIYFSRAERTVLSIQLIFQASLECKLRIEVPDTTLISPGNHRANQICPHTRYIFAIGDSISQPTGILIYL